ncbi:MAG: hypothetical protein QOC73_2375 [Actinomycetota bacterium]|nr:hypothetical protein [Actinomycetota bacterium]
MVSTLTPTTFRNPAGAGRHGMRAARVAPPALLAVVALLLCAGLAPANAAAFSAGAARADITPPPYTTASDAAFVPVCGASAAQVAELWPGPRPFAFEKPYRDIHGLGRYAPGDPYCDADHTGRYEAPYIAGGSGQNHWPTAVEPGNGPAARAVVFAVGGKRVAIVTVDSIGLFNVTMDRIRAAVAMADPSLTQIYISSTHDESAPDPIGLWGPDTSELPEHPETPAAVSSGVDEYYFNFLVERVSGAVLAADHALAPATLNVAVGSMPANTQSCWSSYPYIDDQSMPVMQARDSAGNVIFTLADVSTHAETLAFSGVRSYTETLSADWPGAMRADLEARWPGSVGVELAGMVGSVETPTVYEPESTQVLRVPGAHHGVPGNPDGCSSVYPQPSSGTPVENAVEFISDYGRSVADTVAQTLEGGRTLAPGSLKSQQQAICIPLENNLFKAAFAAGLFPDRPAYADSGCTIEAGGPATGASGPAASSAGPLAAEAEYIKSNVSVLTLGPVQLAYSPGEIFPFTETRGAIDEAMMPFPTDCYEPATENFYCGAPLPMTPWISARMTRPYRFLVGLGEDMAGYMSPPGNFVGAEGEVNSEPWKAYEDTKRTGHDRFGNGHADDAESVGPYAGLTVTNSLEQLLEQDGRGSNVQPGLYLDAQGHLSTNPFASGSFTGAVGVEAIAPGAKRPRKLLIGNQAIGWATFDALADPGTAGTSLPYSVRTAGVISKAGTPLLIDVFAGAKALGLQP